MGESCLEKGIKREEKRAWWRWREMYGWEVLSVAK